MGAETVSAAGGEQIGRAALAVLAEMEIEAGHDMTGADPVQDNRTNEVVGRPAGEFAVEGIFEHGVEAEDLQQPGLQRRGRQTEHGLVRAEDAARVRLEGQYQRGNALAGGDLQRPRQHGLMAAMYPVEIPDGNDAAPQGCRQFTAFFVAMEDGHGPVPHASRGIHQRGFAWWLARKASRACTSVASPLM